jgi:hypothetical protein
MEALVGLQQAGGGAAIQWRLLYVAAHPIRDEADLTAARVPAGADRLSNLCRIVVLGICRRADNVVLLHSSAGELLKPRPCLPLCEDVHAQIATLTSGWCCRRRARRSPAPGRCPCPAAWTGTDCRTPCGSNTDSSLPASCITKQERAS